MSKKKMRKLHRRKKTEPVSSKLPKSRHGHTVIKVVGVGGGGGNAVTRMMEGARIRGVEFMAVNTDAQDLNHATAHHKIYIGKALTRGLGAGMNPDIGKQAAEENRSEIMEALEGTDIVFLTAGFGGGTGTGATPVIAEAAREKGILTIAIITKPFSFEGAERARIAHEGLANLKDKVDSMVVIPNDRIFNLINKDTSVARAFGFVDDVLEQAVQAITEIINVPGLINVDFADIKAVMKDAGSTLIGIGLASGPERSLKAVSLAINSPLLEVSIEGAKRALLSVAGGRDMKMSEVNDIAKAVAANLDPNAKIIFGAYYDRSLKDKALKVTVIAAGFNGIMGSSRMVGIPSLFMNDESKKIPVLEDENVKEEVMEEPKEKKGKKDENWDIPAFLRRKRR
ncbi:MAG TPA: cell division protein FtsZ [Candidatus Paceibacterota bacterium]|nr:cell division protein FtsZ [Candidatus Paceibacterota bacterium]